jgi:predicted house-cleaning noncanonical NTP pyrophosphatase (MazG superfamily)
MKKFIESYSDFITKVVIKQDEHKINIPLFEELSINNGVISNLFTQIKKELFKYKEPLFRNDNVGRVIHHTIFQYIYLNRKNEKLIEEVLEFGYLYNRNIEEFGKYKELIINGYDSDDRDDNLIRQIKSHLELRTKYGATYIHLPVELKKNFNVDKTIKIFDYLSQRNDFEKLLDKNLKYYIIKEMDDINNVLESSGGVIYRGIAFDEQYIEKLIKGGVVIGWHWSLLSDIAQDFAVNASDKDKPNYLVFETKIDYNDVDLLKTIWKRVWYGTFEYEVQLKHHVKIKITAIETDAKEITDNIDKIKRNVYYA